MILTTAPARERCIGFLHTAPSHIPGFNRLLAEIAPDLHGLHVVDESLLSDARSAGEIVPALRSRIAHTLHQLQNDAAVVVCTCSTIGSVAEEETEAGRLVGLRIDRPMADRAISLGPMILVVVALASTAKPSVELVRESGRRVGVKTEPEVLLCDDLWEHFVAGRVEEFRRAIANRISPLLESYNAIVLAQASMAGAELLCTESPQSVLSSPRLGVEAAVRMLRKSKRAI